MKTLGDTTLTLFFIGGVSLNTWAELGNLDRELELYKRLSNKLKRINFVTCETKKIKYKHTGFELNTNILKTNQILGSEIPLWFKKTFW